VSIEGLLSLGVYLGAVTAAFIALAVFVFALFKGWIHLEDRREAP